MRKYDIFITPHAAGILEQIYEYIAFELLEPIYAANQISRLEEKIQSLDILPKRCKVFSKVIYPGQELRRLLVDNYSVFYYIDDNQVIITDILYSRSDIRKRLEGGPL
ncbi:MAG: type II toxin-antitoxin system RelE/ParE family toxin [Selenomonas sp.]|nr:type II toxin-antitoxin system RelE/ParE family toxin [Selenomonas sp.]